MMKNLYLPAVIAALLTAAMAWSQDGVAPVVIRGQAFPRPVETPVGVVNENQLDPETGIPVSYERETAPVVVAAAPGEAPLQNGLPLPPDGPSADALRNAVTNLQLAAVLQRSDAENALRNAGDQGLAALIAFGLYHDLPSVRTKSAELLGAWGGQRALKPLIEAFYGAAYPTITPFQVHYVGTLAQQISTLTGQNFGFDVRRSGFAPQIANRMIAWWQASYERLPAQIGEPILLRSDPQLAAKLKSLRALTLQKRSFGGEILPLDVAAPPNPANANENGYVQLVPIVPPNYGIDRNTNTSLSPSVVKEPAPERDSPGDFRRQQYEEKLRNGIIGRQ